jgi:hypothetical protein
MSREAFEEYKNGVKILLGKAGETCASRNVDRDCRFEDFEAGRQSKQAEINELRAALDQAAAVADSNRIMLLQYQSLRVNFHLMVSNVLGKDYYNMGMDVYECDRICCEDITNKSSLSWLRKLIQKEPKP